jgi:subtilisin family serine protease
MNRSKLLIFFGILFVILLTVLLGFERTSATGSKTEAVLGDYSSPFTPSKTGPVQSNPSPQMVPGVVLVGLKADATLTAHGAGVRSSDANLNAVLSVLDAQSAEPLFPAAQRRTTLSTPGESAALSRIYRLYLPHDADVPRAVQILSAHPAVAYAEPDYLAHLITVPDDPLYAGQWGLVQINAPATWDVVTGTTDVVIAVIDSGLDTTHPDLTGQLWTNPGEIAGNGVDDDNNGYVDDVRGWNFVNDDADLSDNTGHGTQVAGVIAAVTDNGQGVAGVCWNCRLMVVKVTQPGGVANYSDIAAGVAYATQKGADVINLSLGGYSDSATLKAAIAAASETAVVVGGAGNDNKNVSFYPAAYDDYVLAVAGTTTSDTKVGTSNYGPWVDVSAPGEVITTTFSGGGYGATSGTSMAAPFAAGLAGLLQSQHPSWSPGLVRAHIVHTADEIDGLNPGYEGQLGSGRVDAGQAVNTVATPSLVYESHAVDSEPDGRPEPGSTVNLNVTLFNDWAEATNVQATLTTTDPYVTVVSATASYGSIAASESGTNGTSFRFSVSSSAPYAYDISFTLNVTADGGYSVNIPLTIPTSPGITYAHGTLTTQTWTNDRIYIVDNNAGVAAGHTLTIEPGTVVRFDGNYSLSVAGTLIADGTEEQPIRFTSSQANPAAGDWMVIEFLDSSVDATFDGNGNYIGGSILRYAIIEYGQGINLQNAAPFISHNTFQNLSGSGINGNGSPGLVIADNTLTGSGINLPVGGAFTVMRNTVSDAGIVAYGPGVIAENDVTNAPSLGIEARNPLTVTANRVVDCGEGLLVRTGYVSGNLLANNTSNGLSLSAMGTVMAATIVSNTIVFNGDAGVYARTHVSDSIQSLHHNNLLAKEGAYALYNAADDAIDATGNWWGTTDEVTIQASIYDGGDQFGLGPVDYSSYLSGPVQEAPAYLMDVTLTPPSPIGIQTVTFDLTFSRPMDQSIDPTVAFGATEPYTTYQVVDNAQWLDATRWRATYDVTSLVPRGTYTISVSGAKGATTMMSGTLALPLPGGGMEIPEDTRFGFTVDYAGQITDQTPPNPPAVIAGGAAGDPSTVQAMWWASDPDSSITGYRYAIGSAAGATNVVNWTNVSASSVSRSGLGLVEGRQYWFAVQARNEGGLWSASGYSAFVAGQSFQRVFLPLLMRNQ